MAGFNFKNRADIERVLGRTSRESQPKVSLEGPEELKRLTHGWIYKTPAGGIPAATGTSPVVAGSAACTPYYINADAELTALTNDAGSAQTQTIYNIFSGAITANAFITAKEVFGVKVADAEDCG